MHIDDVAGLDKGIGITLARPLPVRLHEQDLSIWLARWADARVDFVGKNVCDEGVDIAAGPGSNNPVRMFLGPSSGVSLKHVLKVTLPSAAALISGNTIEHGVVSGLLQVQVECSVDAKASFVNLL